MLRKINPPTQFVGKDQIVKESIPIDKVITVWSTKSNTKWSNDYTNHYRLNKVRDSVPNSCAHKQSYETEKCTANKRNKKGAMWMYSFMITYSCLPFIIFMLCFNFSMFTQNYGYFYKIVTILWPTTTTRVTSIISMYLYILPYDLDYMHVGTDIIKSLEHLRKTQILKMLKYFTFSYKVIMTFEWSL